MRIALVTAMWGRPVVTRVFADHYRSLDLDCELVGVAVGSIEDEFFGQNCDVVEDLFEVVECGNDPLGKKWNAALDAASDMDADAAVIVGSDDLLSPDYFRRVCELLEEGADYISLRGCYFYETRRRRLVFAPLLGTGVGRCFHRDILNRVGWKLWPDHAQRKLDAHSWTVFKSHVHRHVEIDTRNEPAVFALDIKSGDNMWNLNGTSLVTPNGKARDTVMEECLPRDLFERYFPDISGKLAGL